jgi:small subunit ribosomal protein S7
MSRRRQSVKRTIASDTRYNDISVSKFINIIMIQGKKSLAEKIVYKAFDIIRNHTKEHPLKIFKKALEKIKPLVEVKSRRVGGANYQVPVEIQSNRGLILSFRWIKRAAQLRHEKEMYTKLAHELIDASNNEGEAIKKKEHMHKMADVNKAFAHYLW